MVPHIKGQKTKTERNRKQHATRSNKTALAFGNCPSEESTSFVGGSKGFTRLSRESLQEPNSFCSTYNIYFVLYSNIYVQNHPDFSLSKTWGTKKMDF